MWGIKFRSTTDFTLSEPKETEGKHICEHCLKILENEIKRIKLK